VWVVSRPREGQERREDPYRCERQRENFGQAVNITLLQLQYPKHSMTVDSVLPIRENER
jgi:hypothetical protein